MSTNTQEKQCRKRKFNELNIENEEKKEILNKNEEEKNETLNENDNITTKFAYSIQTKLEICQYSESHNITNAWLILRYFQYKYPTLRENTVKLWLKQGKAHF